MLGKHRPGFRAPDSGCVGVQRVPTSFQRPLMPPRTCHRPSSLPTPPPTAMMHGHRPHCHTEQREPCPPHPCPEMDQAWIEHPVLFFLSLHPVLLVPHLVLFLPKEGPLHKHRLAKGSGSSSQEVSSAKVLGLVEGLQYSSWTLTETDLDPPRPLKRGKETDSHH